jgi:predicted unusual protein kinase regulating ubiquinone biosynthesis (AarF/ABC1/UbiB family)
MSLALVEGLVKSLDPDFDIVKRSLPYFVRYANAHGTGEH